MHGYRRSVTATGMFATRLIGAILLGAMPFVAPSFAQSDRADCIRQTSGPAVAHITYNFETSAGDKDTVQGSGIVIKSDGYILTAAHVVRPPDIYKSPVIKSEIKVKVGGLFEDEYAATVITKQDDLDVALVRIPALQKPWPIGQVDLLPSAEKRTWLYALGYPGNGDLTGAGPGRITAANAVIDGRPTQWWNTDVPLNRGMSGGPIFNEFGEVAGLAGAIKDGTGGTISYVIPISLASVLIPLAGLSDYQLSPCADDPKPFIMAFLEDALNGRYTEANISQPLWQTIQAQTNGTGHYSQLESLGPKKAVDVLQQKNVPLGTWLLIKVTHEKGVSLWSIGYNRLTHQIDASGTDPQPAATPVPQQQTPAVVGTYDVCIGEKEAACFGHQHLACGTNIEGWAKVACRTKFQTTHTEITKISDRGGNKCGYAIFDVQCLKP